MKPKILIFLGIAWPGNDASGPLVSLKALKDNLGHQFEFYVISREDPSKQRNWSLSRILITSDNPHYVKSLSYYEILSVLRDKKWSMFYFNSFFDPLFTIAPLIMAKFQFDRNIPILVGPRGELSPGALSLKPIRKNLYLWIGSVLGLFKNLNFHATSEEEAAEIYQALPSARGRTIVASNIRSVAESCRGPDQLDKLKIVYLSRIDRKKNLHYAINVVKQLNIPACFDIYGPISDVEYWKECQRIINKTSDNVSIKHCGAIANKSVSHVLSVYDIFLLPTLGENFGHAIFDSLSVGTPVLISDKTPWRGLKEIGAGWDVNLDNGCDEFINVLENYYRLSRAQRQVHQNSALQLAKDHVRRSDAIVKNNLMLTNIIYGSF